MLVLVGPVQIQGWWGPTLSGLQSRLFCESVNRKLKGHVRMSDKVTGMRPWSLVHARRYLCSHRKSYGKYSFSFFNFLLLFSGKILGLSGIWFIIVNSNGTDQTDLAFYFFILNVNLISYKTVMNEEENQNKAQQGNLNTIKQTF